LSALSWLFEKNIKMRLDLLTARCAFGATTPDEPTKMITFFMLQNPGIRKLGIWPMIRHGILLIPFKFGFQSFNRLLEVIDLHEKQNVRIMRRMRIEFGNQIQCCHLERMVVRPEWQGKGHGSAYLGQALCEAAAKGHCVLLSTQGERNVKFYSALGFEVALSGLVCRP
jgi:GNAT superfamily N-acetyltransferase